MGVAGAPGTFRPGRAPEVPPQHDVQSNVPTVMPSPIADASPPQAALPPLAMVVRQGWSRMRRLHASEVLTRSEALEIGPGRIRSDGTPTTSSVDRHAVIDAAFEAYHNELYGFLRRSTRDDEAAKDLVQDAYLRLTREVEAGRVPDHVRAWLYRVASNLAVSRARRRATVVDWIVRHGRREVEVEDLSPETAVLDRERSSALEEVLATLPADARIALLLSAEGFSGEEIAATIGRTHVATRALLCRARVRARLLIEQQGSIR